MRAGYFNSPISKLGKQKVQIQSGNPFPLSACVSYNKLSSSYKAFVTSMTSQEKPRNYLEARTSPEWRNAMKAEIKTLELNDTWWLLIYLLTKKQ